MKIQRILLLSLGALLAGAPSHAQVVLAKWTFETTTPADLLNASLYPGFNADTGAGTASGFHASSATNWTTPTGNGSANSFSSANWSLGDFYQFQVSAAGFQNIFLSWSQTSSGTGPANFKLAYSGDGVAFTDFGPAYTVLANTGANAWSAGTAVLGATFSRDLSTIGTLNDDASIFFRLIDTSAISAGGGTVSAAGANRIDDFSVSGFALPTAPPITPVPEPATWGLAAVATLALGVFLRRRSRSA